VTAIDDTIRTMVRADTPDVEAQVALLTTVVNRLDREVEQLEEYIEVSARRALQVEQALEETMAANWGEEALMGGASHLAVCYRWLKDAEHMRDMINDSWFLPKRPQWRAALYGPHDRLKAIGRENGIKGGWTIQILVDLLRRQGVHVDRRDALPAFDARERKRQVRDARARAEYSERANAVRMRYRKREAS
jgi:hypothetical protein